MGENKPGVWVAVTAAFCTLGFMATDARRAAGVSAGIGVAALLAESAVWYVRRRRAHAAQRPRPTFSWRRIANAVLALIFGYVAGGGPAVYVAARGWPLGEPLFELYRPLVADGVMTGPLGRQYGRYLLWWADRGAAARRAESGRWRYDDPGVAPPQRRPRAW